MARSARRAIDYEDEGSPGSTLARFLVWAGLAAAALGSAALAAQTRTGTERLVSLLGLPAPAGGAGKPAAPASVVIRPSDAEIESRRLAEAVRLLTADRDRVLARLETLEHSLEVTGSIPRGLPASSAPDGPVVPPNWSLVPSSIPLAAGLPPAAGLTPPVVPTAPGAGFPAAGAPTTTTHSDVHAASGRTPQHGSREGGALVANEQAAESVATKTEFAVDIGGEQSFDGLRALWASLKASHATLFEGLRPVAAVREGAKPGVLELRLVVGPLSNAGAAARLCATLAAAGLPCQPTVFDGQRFALR